jgi:hypothetical protein
MVRKQGADGVFRKHHARDTDFRRGKKLGIGDHYVVWHKPRKCPDHMSETEFARLPETEVREVCLRHSRQGFRDQRVIVVTTLLDAKQYSAQQLTRLYGLRWQAAEVNLRHLKTTLRMEMLTANPPEMVQKTSGRIFWPTTYCERSCLKRLNLLDKRSLSFHYKALVSSLIR